MASMLQKALVAANGAVQHLIPMQSAKPWGRHDLGPWGLSIASTESIGEIHHCLAGDADPELLVKTLFTGERLSVQVHPGTTAAKAAGHARGKDEAWLVLAAAPGAVIGLGLKTATTAAALRAAALDGSIIDMMVWHPCAAGDVFHTPAGTIHAIGGGVTLFEVQQNLDLTYRLFDYGRGRELHLDAALAVADLSAWAPPPRRPPANTGREVLVEGPGFVMERLHVASGGTLNSVRPTWIGVITGAAALAGDTARVGEVWYTEAPLTIVGHAELLLAYPGAVRAPALWNPA